MFDIESAYQRALTFEVISFDIFDTVLLRKVLNPTDIFQVLSETHAEFGSDFKKRRELSEKLSRIKNKQKYGNYEVTFSDIYAEIGMKSSNEFEVEKKFIQRNSEIYDLITRLRLAGKTIIFITDIYFSSDEIEMLLEEAGVAKPDHLFVSSELKLSKGIGDIYPHVLKQLKIAGRQILHIGDNEHSDVKMAKQYGIASILYPEKRGRVIARKKHLTNLAKYDIYGSIISGILANDSEFEMQRKEDYWRNLGFGVAGPLYAGFLSWLDEQFEKDKIECSLFVSRDGYLVKKYYDLYFGKVKTQYFYQSRKVVGQLLAEFDFDMYIANLMRQNRISLNEALDSFELFEINNIPESDFVRRNGRKYVDQKSIQKNLPKFLKENQEAIRNFYKERNYTYFSYLEETIDKSKKTAFIDVGWHGTQQKQTSLLTAMPFTGYVLALHPWAADPSNIRGYVYDANHMNEGFHTIHQSIEVFELLFSAPDNSLLGLNRTTEGFVPYFVNDDEFANLHREIVLQIDRGIGEFLKEIMPLISNFNRRLPSNVALAMAHETLFFPEDIDLEILGKHTHNPNPGKGKAITLIPEISIRGHRTTHIFWRVGYLKKLQKNTNFIASHLLLFIEYLKIWKNIGFRRGLEILTRRLKRQIKKLASKYRKGEPV